jgi:hypothetical protein
MQISITAEELHTMCEDFALHRALKSGYPMSHTGTKVMFYKDFADDTRAIVTFFRKRKEEGCEQS